MIQANELRIGNYLKDQDGLIVVVKGIDSDRSYEHNGKMHVGTAQCYYNEYNGTIGKWLETLEPITLTEDILLKCGFKGSNETIFTRNDIGSIYFRKPYLESSHYLIKTNSGNKITSVTHLHKLQNIYFALTGKELLLEL